MKEASDWTKLPRAMFVVAAKSDGVVFEATLCNVPLALAPEVVYKRDDTSGLDAASPLREQLRGAIRAWTSATTTEADDAARAILVHVNNWYSIHTTRPVSGLVLEALSAENEALKDMVASAYNAGFCEGMKEVTSKRGGTPWSDSTFKKRIGR